MAIFEHPVLQVTLHHRLALENPVTKRIIHYLLVDLHVGLLPARKLARCHRLAVQYAYPLDTALDWLKQWRVFLQCRFSVVAECQSFYWLHLSNERTHPYPVDEETDLLDDDHLFGFFDVFHDGIHIQN